MKERNVSLFIIVGAMCVMDDALDFQLEYANMGCRTPSNIYSCSYHRVKINKLLLVFSMNFSAYTFACMADVAGLLRKIRLPFSKWVRFLILSISTLTMDILLYSYYGNFGKIIPILCFAVFYPLIVLSFGGRNS